MAGKKSFAKLSQEDKALITDSWGKAYGNNGNIGVPMLIRLFEVDPSSKQYFSKYKDIDDHQALAKNPEMIKLAGKFMAAVNTMVENVDNAEKATSVFNTLGNSHALNEGVDFKYFKVLSDVIVTVLKETNKDVMTSTVTKAWNNFFTEMCANFRDVYQEVGGKGV